MKEKILMVVNEAAKDFYDDKRQHYKASILSMFEERVSFEEAIELAFSINFPDLTYKISSMPIAGDSKETVYICYIAFYLEEEKEIEEIYYYLIDEESA